jgi:hypothetical protein
MFVLVPRIANAASATILCSTPRPIPTHRSCWQSAPIHRRAYACERVNRTSPSYLQGMPNQAMQQPRPNVLQCG